MEKLAPCLEMVLECFSVFWSTALNSLGKGFSVTYSNGDICSGVGNRKVVISFTCAVNTLIPSWFSILSVANEFCVHNLTRCSILSIF